MANADFTAPDNLTPEQLKEQYPINCDPFGVWYHFESERPHEWAINDSNGNGFTEAISYEKAVVISDALKIKHQSNGLFLDGDDKKIIIDALLIGLASFGEIERIEDAVRGFDLATTVRIPGMVRPIHPTGASDTIGLFAEALQYMNQK